MFATPPDLTRHTVSEDAGPIGSLLQRTYIDVQRGTARLINAIPSTAWDFAPSTPQLTTRQLVHHITEVGGRMARGIILGDWKHGPIPPSAECTDDRNEALQRLDMSMEETLKLLAGVSDAEFEKREVKMPWGSAMTIARATLALIEHDTHHRTQLFLYLRQQGAEVNTMTIFG